MNRIKIEYVIIVILTVLALAGWTRHFDPTPKNLSSAANDVVQDNPNLAVVLYTVADALDEGYIHPLAFMATSFQERFLLNNIVIPEKKSSDVDA